MILGPLTTLFMDEISTGLDSSTTLQIVKCVKHMIKVFRTTMVISLLQPAPETFNLFDDVILLCEGQIVYHGPCDSIVEFFEGRGFKCPDRKGIADFLEEVASRKDQEQYWYDRRQPYRYIPVEEFAQAFWLFRVGENLGYDLEAGYDKTKSHPSSLGKNKYGLPKGELFKACWDREILLMKRNAFVYIFKSVQIAFVALITMFVFLRTEMDHKTLQGGQTQKYMGVIFFGLSFESFYFSERKRNEVDVEEELPES